MNISKTKDWAPAVLYLEDEVTDGRQHPPSNPWAGRTQDGYTSIKGAPTELMLRCGTRNTWRRVWVLQFSNAASYFVNINGERRYLRESQIDEVFHKIEL